MSNPSTPQDLNLLSLLDQLPFGVFVKDAEGRYVIANEMACEVAGWNRIDLIGKTDFDLVPKAVADAIRAHDDELRQNGFAAPRDDTRIIRGEKHVFVVQKVRLAMTTSPKGWVLGYAIDITQLRQTQNALLEEQRFINQVLDTAPNLIFVKDAEGKFVLVNQAFANLYGRPKSAFLQRSNAEIHRQGAEASGYSHDDQKVIETSEPVRRERAHTLDSGEVLWFDTLKTPLVRHDGNVHVLGISTDISARKRAEQSRIDSEAQIRALLDAIPDHLIVLDAEGRCIRARPDLSRRDAERFRVPIGQNVIDMFPGNLATAMLAAHARIRAGEQLVSFEHEWVQNAFHHDYEVRCTSLPAGSVMFLIRDITERKEMERLKDEFIAVVSHELRTPLTALSGSLKLLASGIVGELAEGPREMVDIALEGSDRLVHLVNDILDMDKIERGRMDIELEAVNVRLAIIQSIAEHDALAQKTALRLQFVGNESNTTAQANEHWLRQVLGNLVSNAIKFSPSGSIIEFDVFDALDGRWIRIELRDEGPGISEQFRSRLFQKFAQADGSSIRRVGGTGLGLSICKQVVDQMGGRIGQLNRPTGGSTFFIELPRDTV